MQKNIEEILFHKHDKCPKKKLKKCILLESLDLSKKKYLIKNKFFCE